MNWKYLILLTVVLFSCKKIDKLTNFYADFSQEITFFTGDEPGSTIDIWIFNILQDKDSLFKENHSDIYGTNKIALSEITLSSIDTMDISFNYIESVEVYMTANEMQEKKIAWLDKIPEDITKIVSLDFTDDDLKNYMKDKDYALNIRLVSKGTDNIETTFDFSYTVYINSNFDD